MSVPKKRKSKSRKKRGTASLYPLKGALVTCPKCKKPKLPHVVCMFCGAYKGKQVVEMAVSGGKKKEQADKEAKKSSHEHKPQEKNPKDSQTTNTK